MNVFNQKKRSNNATGQAKITIVEKTNLESIV